MEYLNTTSLMNPLATSFGAFSSFPKSKFLGSLSDNVLFQWFCTFVLIYQGMGGGNTTLAIVTTIVTFFLVTVIDMVFKAKEGYASY